MSEEQVNSRPSSEFFADIELARAVAAREQRARTELVQRLLPRAPRLCQALLRNVADAKDASQAALVAILGSAHTYRGECSIERWADRIISRTALRWARAERRVQRTQPPKVATPHGDTGPPRVVLQEYLNHLPEVQRTTLLLRCCLQYSVKEVAELTGVSVNTVKDRLTRARQSVRALVVNAYRPDAELDESDIKTAY